MKIDLPKNTVEVRAAYFAIGAHNAIGQIRKYSGEPYWYHPYRVVKILRTVTSNSQILAAGWLHDVVEDTDVTIEQIDDIFGKDIAELVSDVTDISKPEDGNRAFRKEMDRMHLAKASDGGQTIKLADLIDNTEDIVQNDRHFAVVYLKEKERLLQVLNRGDKELFKIASEQIKI